MSLINQALRKAQRDRTPARMADPGSTGPSTTAPLSASGMKPGLVIGLVVAVAVLLGLVAGLSMVLLKSNDPAPVAQQAPATPEESPSQDTAASPPTEPAAATPEALEPLTPPIESAANFPGSAGGRTSPVVEELRKAREAAEAKASAEAEAAQAEAAAEAKAAEEAAARAAAKPSQDIIEWLSRAQISGVRLSSTESKVILNGDAYAVGEYVNYALGLKVMVIQEERVLFIDENGKKYMKRL